MGFSHLIHNWILLFQTIYSFASCANIYMIQPNKGPQLGGTQVSVYGNGFSSRSTLCRFGWVPVTCRFISTSTLICTSPTCSSIERVTVEVSVDSTGFPETFSNDKILFRYQGMVIFRQLSLPYFVSISLIFDFDRIICFRTDIDFQSSAFGGTTAWRHKSHLKWKWVRGRRRSHLQICLFYRRGLLCQGTVVEPVLRSLHFPRNDDSWSS
jgi:hypothetical protein